jgi:hypothetical protein
MASGFDNEAPVKSRSLEVILGTTFGAATMKSALGLIIFFGAMALFLWNHAPRLVNEVWHAHDFVPAQGHKITNYECTNWNAVMFNDCTVTFAPLQGGASRQITDWRLGRAPQDPILLLQRRDDPSSMTTNVSLQTLWNRVAFAFMFVLFGVFLAIGLLKKAGDNEDAPIDPAIEPAIDPASGEPALQPMARPMAHAMAHPMGPSISRSTFGKRRA